MLRLGVSSISALIKPDASAPKDVFLQIRRRYVSGSTCWRRVPWLRRPNVVGGFQLPARSWRRIEHLNGLNKPASDLRSGDSSWRIVRREGSIFAIEVSVLPKAKARPHQLSPSRSSLPPTAPKNLPPPPGLIGHFILNQQPGIDGNRDVTATLQLSFGHLSLRPRTLHDLAGQHIRAAFASGTIQMPRCDDDP